jgi:hypothetical protein
LEKKRKYKKRFERDVLCAANACYYCAFLKRATDSL